MSATLSEPIIQGNEVRIGVEWFNEEDALTDGTTVCTVIPPRGAVIVPEVQRASVGVFFAIVLVGPPGNWEYRFASTGALVGAAEGTFPVANSKFV